MIISVLLDKYPHVLVFLPFPEVLRRFVSELSLHWFTTHAHKGRLLFPRPNSDAAVFSETSYRTRQAIRFRTF